MRPPTRRELTVAVAVLLIAVPIWAPPLDVTGPDYRYETAELSTQNGKLAVDTPDGSHVHDVEGIDCFDRSFEFTRRCFYDGGAIDGNVTGVNPSIVDVSDPAAAGELTRTGDDEYVMLADEIYRRSTTFVDANESVGVTVELGVERVDPATALADVAHEEVSEPARTAIETGSVTTDEPIEDANEVLVVDGEYYVVFEESQQRSYPANPGTERLFEAVSVAAGGWLLLRS
ncbi:hypothetical protein [Halolamina salina]|uniref:Uncharacterized protein n=1 Tax=Halolamina salina TaxID=1220023 RepID=A0ABD6B9S2_9EURY